ncbi:MAG: hypothetical protein R6W78_07660 [Bacteroidales bacterium]
MKRIVVLTVLLLIMLAYINAQTKDMDKLLKNFQSTEWTDVLKAKENLENTQAECIPGLIVLLDNNSFKKLMNTGDLIYPGADRFFGHGQIINYDIDKIDVRAGWLLEELIFQNFGFSGIHVSPQELNDYIKFNFPKFYNNAKNRQLIDKSTDKEKRELVKELSIEAAKLWWASEGDDWNRLDAIVEALESDDEKRQAKALFYLRNGKTACTGLTIEVYKDRIQTVVNELSKSPLKRISEQAKLIMLDTDYDWMKLKVVL